jgi:hypothetical protein
LWRSEFSPDLRPGEIWSSRASSHFPESKGAN